MILLSFLILSMKSAIAEIDCQCFAPSAEEIGMLMSAQGCIRSTEDYRPIQLHCADPGAWIPTEAQLAELEGALPHTLNVSGHEVAWGPKIEKPAPAVSPNAMTGPDLSKMDCAAWRIECRAIDWATHTTAPSKQLEARIYPPFTRYSRYYASVTRDGERVIIGLFLYNGDHESPKRLIVDESEFPIVLDGGCDVVSVIYNPQTKNMKIKCNGG